MKCFYKELTQRKKFLITELNNEIASIEWLWFQKEISNKEYLVKYKDLEKRIEELQG